MGLPKNTPTVISLLLTELFICVSSKEWDEYDLDKWDDPLYWVKGENSPNPTYIRKDIVIDYLKKASTSGWERAEKELMDELSNE